MGCMGSRGCRESSSRGNLSCQDPLSAQPPDSCGPVEPPSWVRTHSKADQRVSWAWEAEEGPEGTRHSGKA